MTRLTLLHSRGGGRGGVEGVRQSVRGGADGVIKLRTGRVGGMPMVGIGGGGVGGWQVASGQRRMRSLQSGWGLLARWPGGPAGEQANDKSHDGTPPHPSFIHVSVSRS